MTLTEARNEMLALVKTAWDTTTFEMQWEDRPFIKPVANTPWARTTVRHADGGQATLCDSVCRWNRVGTLFVQIFCPSGEGSSRGYGLAQTVMNALEGAKTAGGVWFRNTRIREIGPDGDWFQINVLTDFNYDEIK